MAEVSLMKKIVFETKIVKEMYSVTLTLHIYLQESLSRGAWGQRSSQVTNMGLQFEGWKTRKHKKESEPIVSNEGGRRRNQGCKRL